MAQLAADRVLLVVLPLRPPFMAAPARRAELLAMPALLDLLSCRSAAAGRIALLRDGVKATGAGDARSWA